MSKEKQNKNTNIYKILAIVFIAAFLICVVILGVRAVRQKAAQDKLNDLASQTTDTSNVVVDTEAQDALASLGIEIPQKNIDWNALQEENADIYAWIYIPNTKVDYPILQHPTEDDYYLDHNIDGSSGYPGCIYSQSMNSKDFTDSNTVLYGHNMKDDSMFGSLHEFEDNEFFDENPFIYIYTPEKTYVYTIFAACTAGNGHLLYAYDFDTEAGFDQFVTDVSSVRDMNSHVRTGIGMVYGRKLLTLSTCISGQSDKRWIVTAVLMNE